MVLGKKLQWRNGKRKHKYSSTNPPIDFACGKFEFSKNKRWLQLFMWLRAGRGSASTYTPINTIALGADSLSNAAQCTRNSIFIGVQSGVYAEETDNVIAIGTMSASGTALAFTANLISIGTCTGNTDSDSIYIGTRAGFCAIGGARQNVFIGNMAGRCNTSGSNNLFFGCN